jgi:hypothetical protein
MTEGCKTEPGTIQSEFNAKAQSSQATKVDAVKFAATRPAVYVHQTVIPKTGSQVF